MQKITLQKIIKDQAIGRPVVLATYLTTGEEELIYPLDSIGNKNLLEHANISIDLDKSAIIDTKDGPVFLHVFNSPLQLILVGAVHIAQPLSAIATISGYNVTIIDPRLAFISSERFPNVSLRTEWPDEALEIIKPDNRTAIVTLTHDPKLDDPALKVAMKSPAFYIGALGSKKTHATRKQRMTEDGISEANVKRIHGPVGLNIFAKSPSEIAVSILAEITFKLRGTQ